MRLVLAFLIVFNTEPCELGVVLLLLSMCIIKASVGCLTVSSFYFSVRFTLTIIVMASVTLVCLFSLSCLLMHSQLFFNCFLLLSTLIELSSDVFVTRHVHLEPWMRNEIRDGKSVARLVT